MFRSLFLLTFVYKSHNSFQAVLVPSLVIDSFSSLSIPDPCPLFFIQVFSIPFSSVFFVFLCVCVCGSMVPPLPDSHMLFCLSAMTTVSLEGLGNNVLRAPLCSGELFSQLDRRLHSYVNQNCTLWNIVCLKRDNEASTQWWVLTKNDKRGRIRKCQAAGEHVCHCTLTFCTVTQYRDTYAVNPRSKIASVQSRQNCTCKKIMSYMCKKTFLPTLIIYSRWYITVHNSTFWLINFSYHTPYFAAWGG